MEMILRYCFSLTISRTGFTIFQYIPMYYYLSFVKVDDVITHVQLFGDSVFRVLIEKMRFFGSDLLGKNGRCFRHQALGNFVMLFTSTKDEHGYIYGILYSYGCANITFKDKKKQYKDK